MVCVDDGVNPPWIYGEYKDTDSNVHFVDMEWDPQEEDFNITESGAHETGGFGPKGFHSQSMYWYSDWFDHYWGLDPDDGDPEEGHHNQDDLHWEHTFGYATDLYDKCGWFQF